MEIMGQLSVMRYTIGGIQEYRDFIEALREKLTKRKDGSKEEIKVGEKHSAAVLPKRDKQEQLLHIELHATTEKQNSNGSWTTTLAMRKHNLYIVGFTGKDGRWFQLVGSHCSLPKEYQSTLLPWDVSYKGIMNLLKHQDQVKRTLSHTRLGKDFAIRAVRRLSLYPDVDYKDENPTRLGLAGLIVLICESARMETIREVFGSKREWEEGVVIKEHVLDHIWNWGTLSANLMRWKKHDYEHEYAGDSNPSDALDRLGLVLNSNNVGEGGARVEIFAVSANFEVTSITVTDDANPKGYPIYNHEGRVVTPTKNKLFVTWNIGVSQQDYVLTIIEKAVKQFSPEISNIMMGLIIIQFRNEDLANSAFREMPQELVGKEVTISREDPRITAKGMVDLELNVVPKGISGYKWFDFDIKLQGAVATEPVTWRRRLDCRKQGGDATVVTHNMAFDSEHTMDVAYLVMSDTVKAKVEVKLRHRGDPYGPTAKQDGESKCTVHGEIAARIDGFDHRIVLFRINEKSKAKAVARGPTLPLDRSDVWVPRDKRVHIEMKHLHVTFGDRGVVSIPDRCLSFDFGELSPSSGDNDSEVKVNIAWDGIPEKRVKPDDNDKVRWIVGDDAQAFTERIVELREKVATRSQEHVLQGYKRKDLKGISKRPILAKRGDYFIEAKRCVHFELEAKVDAEPWSTTLAVRDDNCSGVGFMNQSGVWYDLGHLWGYGWRDQTLPAEYNSVFLGWGVGYNQILQTSDWREELNKAGKKFITEDFVTNAVRTLSRYPDVEDGMNPRIAAVALMIVTCESAKLDFLHKSFERDWGTNKVEFITKDMKDYVLAWEEMSATLVHWKYHFYRSWPDQSLELKRISITSQRLALEAVHLVLNRRALPDQIDVTYTIDDDEERYTRFIHELRRIVRMPVGVLPRRPGDGPMWWNIQLKVAGKEETSSITLALSGDDLCICGFRSQQENIWYQIDSDDRTMFIQEYGAFAIPIQHIYCRATYGKTAAMEAVDALSQYSYESPTITNIPDSAWYLIVEEDGTDHLLSPLATLQLMVTYSASIIKVHDAVVRGWRLEGMKADPELLELTSFWNGISKSALEQWERCEGDSPPWDDHDNKLLERIGIKSPQGALEAFALIKDAKMPPQAQFHFGGRSLDLLSRLSLAPVE